MDKTYKLELSQYDRDIICEAAKSYVDCYTRIIEVLEGLKLHPRLTNDPSSSNPVGEMRFKIKNMERVIELLK